MPLNIAVNENYRITSDSHNIIVSKRKVVDPTKAPNWEKRKKEGASPDLREVWEETAYCKTIERALDKIYHQTTLDSDATTISELLSEIQQTSREISDVLGK